MIHISYRLHNTSARCLPKSVYDVLFREASAILLREERRKKESKDALSIREIKETVVALLGIGEKFLHHNHY